MNTTSTQLQDRIALVTAGASGIGRVIADQLYDQGATVYICDISPDALGAVSEDERMRCHQVDVSDVVQVAKLLETIEKEQGRLDILINNAGIAGPTAGVEDVSVEDWRATLAVDLDGVFYVTKYATPLLKKSTSSAIVNMSSNAAFSGCPLRSPYSAAKWAIVGLTKTWAMELGGDQIRVNALCPGSVEGARIDRVMANDAKERGVDQAEIRRIYESQSSLKRFVEAKDIASMVLFLVSDSGRYISGQAIGINGHTESLASLS